MLHVHIRLEPKSDSEKRARIIHSAQRTFAHCVSFPTLTKEQKKEYHMAWNAWKRCCRRVDSQGEHFTSIHDRFLRDPVYRESQLALGWTEQKCKEWDELAQEDHTYRLIPEEKKRYQGQRYLTLNKAGKNGPLKLRPDFRALSQ